MKWRVNHVYVFLFIRDADHKASTVGSKNVLQLTTYIHTYTYIHLYICMYVCIHLWSGPYVRVVVVRID